MKKNKGDMQGQQQNKQYCEIDIKKPSQPVKSASKMPNESNVKRSAPANDKFKDLMNRKLGD